MEDRRGFQILTSKHRGKGFLGRPRRRWEDNIRLILKKWIGWPQCRDYWRAHVNAVFEVRPFDPGDNEDYIRRIKLWMLGKLENMK
jgi:hypothetical protein